MLSLSKHIYYPTNLIERIATVVEMLRQAQHDVLFYFDSFWMDSLSSPLAHCAALVDVALPQQQSRLLARWRYFGYTATR